jgi:L-aminopeptidase/D-esterase-like protein
VIQFSFSAARRIARGTVLGACALVVAVPATAQAQPDEMSNTLTDVPGLKVGHYTQFGDGYRTGTTVILTEDGATTGYSQQGGGPGTKETDLLEPGGLVTEVNAIVLTGGSAYGLDSITGVMEWLEERDIGYPVGAGVVPIVPGAVLFDLGRGGDFSARPDASFGYQAADNATGDPVEMGRVGAGMGANRGLGSASVELPNGYRVGAIVGLNPGGSPVNPDTCLPYAEFLEIGDEFNLTQPTRRDCPGRQGGNAATMSDGEYEEPFNTTIAVVATDAPLDQTQAQRMAMIANSGLARSIRPVHNLGDGDTVFGMSTTGPTESLPNNVLGQVYNAAADALGRAVVHALLESETVGSNVAYCEQYPSACRNRDRGARGAADLDEADAGAAIGIGTPDASVAALTVFAGATLATWHRRRTSLPGGNYSAPVR